MLFIIILAALLSFARPLSAGGVHRGKTQEPPERQQSSYGSVKGLLKPRQQNSAQAAACTRIQVAAIEWIHQLC